MAKSGFTKAWRKELESDIWKMPPLYHRVWHFLVQSVSWEKNTFPTRNLYGIHLNPGQNLFSINQIVDGVSWVERNVKKSPNKKTVLDILKWLEFQGMISRESNGSGTYINICNWCKYQSEEKQKVTESIPEGIPQGKPESIPQSVHTKEVKEVEEGKEKDIYAGEDKLRLCPHQEIIKIYNTVTSKKLSPVKPKLWNGARAKALATRWKEDDERQSLDWWQEFFERVMRSSFLTGENNRGWMADMGWLLKYENFVKVLEGKYDTKDDTAWQ